MFRMGKKAEYALIAMAHMARLPSDQLASNRELAKLYDMPPEILGKVLQALTRARLILSLQGVKGGYHLAQPATQIMVAQIIEAVEGPLHLAPCALDHYRCQQSHRCNIRRPVFRLQERLLTFIRQLNLADFICDELMAELAPTVNPPSAEPLPPPAREPKPCSSPRKNLRKSRPATALPAN